MSTETVNYCYKTRLYTFWLNQDILYNFCWEIHGTGSPGEVPFSWKHRWAKSS